MTDFDCEASLESDYHDDSMNDVPIIIDQDDITVESNDFGSIALSRPDSVESMLSSDTMSRVVDRMTCFDRVSVVQNHQGREITLHLPEERPQVRRGVSSTGGPNQILSSNHSCNSIKDYLSLDSIDEDTDSFSWSFEGSDLGVPLTSGKKSTGKRTDAIRRQWNCDPVTARTVAGRRKAKIKIISDPLLNRFIENRRALRDSHRSSSVYSTGRVDQKNAVLTPTVIMNKTDSLNHVSIQGKRVVRTVSRNDDDDDDDGPSVMTTAKSRRSFRLPESKDLLLEDFLLLMKKDEKREDTTSTTHSVSTVFQSTDSLQRIHGKGRRLVGTGVPIVGFPNMNPRLNNSYRP